MFNGRAVRRSKYRLILNEQVFFFQNETENENERLTAGKNSFDLPCWKDERFEFRRQMAPDDVLRGRNAECRGHRVAGEGRLQNHQAAVNAAIC